MAQKDFLLYDSAGLEYPYEETQSSLPNETFKKYRLVEGKWILYRNPNFNVSISGGSLKDILILEKPGPQTALPADFNPRSIRRLHDESDTAELFEHFYYGGKSVPYTEPCEDVTGSFPTTDPEGVSSIIIWPNKSWELYKEKYYQGGTVTLPPNKYPTPKDMGFGNDTLKSLRPS